MKIAIVLDSIEHLKPNKDTSIAMLASAQKMGWHTVFFTLADLFSEQGEPYANVHQLILKDVHNEHWCVTKTIGVKPLSEFDIILMRKEPPFDLEYIYATYILELAAKKGVLVANHPQSLRDANEKFYTQQFPQCTPKTLVSKDINRLKSFWFEHQDVVYKPLDGMGGSSIFHVNEEGHNLSVILETLTHHETQTVMAQKYIPEIRGLGDKRIILIDGEPVPYALARVPKDGDFRGNLAAGAKGYVVPITERDKWICDELSPVLKEKKLYFVGIDVIGDYLTEINVTCPTCAQEIMRETGIDITGDYLRKLAQKVIRHR